MENATKALLIAAAVLVAIIIISLTLGVVRQGQEAVSSADMSEAQLEAFNSKFKTYEGTNVSTADVKALLNALLSHNQQEAASGSGRYVKVSGGAITQATNATSVTAVAGNNYYSVTCVYTKGLITEVKITKK